MHLTAQLGVVSAPPRMYDEEIDLEALERKERRRAVCGRYGVQPDVLTGKAKRVFFCCGQWRDGFCPLCYARRREQIQSQLKEGVGQCQQPVLILLEEDEATRLVRRLRDQKVLYARYPSFEGDFVLYDGAAYDGYVNGEHIPYDDVDVDYLTDTPQGRRISGKLGKPPAAPEPEEEKILVTVETIIADPGEGHTRAEAWKLAVERTSYLDPDLDVMQLEMAIHARMDAYRKAIQEMGGRVEHIYKTKASVSVNSLVDWSDKELSDASLYFLDLPDNIDTPP